jgi:UDP-sulfoquinovose synthase
MEAHYYNPAHTGLLDLKPYYLTRTWEVLIEMMAFVMKYRENIAEYRIFRGTTH